MEDGDAMGLEREKTPKIKTGVLPRRGLRVTLFWMDRWMDRYSGWIRGGYSILGCGTKTSLGPGLLQQWYCSTPHPPDYFTRIHLRPSLLY